MKIPQIPFGILPAGLRKPLVKMRDVLNLLIGDTAARAVTVQMMIDWGKIDEDENPLDDNGDIIT